MLEFIKEKSYYLLGGTVILLVIIIIIASCSNNSGGSSYSKIEEKMKLAAKNYYDARKNKLPKEDGGVVKVNIGTLVDAELLEEIKDPKNKENTCTGYVEVTKVGEDYSYMPFLTCKGSYEPKYLTDVIKDVKTDEYGNGVYNMNGEYIYRGKNVNNYVKFDNKLWRIIKIDKDGDIKIVSAEPTEDSYPYDTAYNSESEDNSGITTDFLKTDIRKTLNDYYKSLSKEAKAKIVKKQLCVGSYLLTDEFSYEKECSKLTDYEYIGLLNPTDYQNASLATECKILENRECSNYNYLANKNFRSWLLNTYEKKNYKVLNISSGSISISTASNEKRLNFALYVNNKAITLVGNGTLETPYEIKM